MRLPSRSSFWAARADKIAICVSAAFSISDWEPSSSFWLQGVVDHVSGKTVLKKPDCVFGRASRRQLDGEGH